MENAVGASWHGVWLTLILCMCGHVCTYGVKCVDFVDSLPSLCLSDFLFPIGPYPHRSRCTGLQTCESNGSCTPLAGCGACGVDVYFHPACVELLSVEPGTKLTTAEWYMSGRLRPTRFARVDDSKTMS